jgi:hypothetical protein
MATNLFDHCEELAPDTDAPGPSAARVPRRLRRDHDLALFAGTSANVKASVGAQARRARARASRAGRPRVREAPATESVRPRSYDPQSAVARACPLDPSERDHADLADLEAGDAITLAVTGSACADAWRVELEPRGELKPRGADARIAREAPAA